MDQSPRISDTHHALSSQTRCSSNTLFTTIIVAFMTSILASVGTYMFTSPHNPQAPISSSPPEPSPTIANDLSPTTDNTSTWKHIVIDEAGISFRYPDHLFPYNGLFEVPNSTYFGFIADNNPNMHDPRALTEQDVTLQITVWRPMPGGVEDYLSVITTADDRILTNATPSLMGSWTKLKTLYSGATPTAIIYSDTSPEYSDYHAYLVDGTDVAQIRLMTGSHTKRHELVALLEQIAFSFKFTK